jgi:spore germination cell wall hydrolase CwlJ-like protein
LDFTEVYAALGDAPRCIPREKPNATAIAESYSSNRASRSLADYLAAYKEKERDFLIRTIVFEASGEPEAGKAAVAHVIINRKKTGRWGDNIEDVVTEPWQFEPWMTRRREMEKLSPLDIRYQEAAAIADAVLEGQTPDPTAGATHFLNPVIVRQRRGGSLPAWARGEGLPIGRHTFYLPDEGPGGLDSLPVTAVHHFNLSTLGRRPLEATSLASLGIEEPCAQQGLSARSPAPSNASRA